MTGGLYLTGIIALLGFLIGLAKGGFSGVGGLLTPLLSLVLPVSQAVGVLLPMLIAGDAFAVYTYWGEWDWALVRRMLPPAAVGALAGAWLLARLPASALRLALAGFVLLLVAYRLVSDRLPQLSYAPRAWHAPVVGLVSGLASGLFNNGGPPFNAFLLLQRPKPRVFIATNAVFFALLNLLKLPAFLYTGVLDGPRLLSLWWVFVFIPLGLLAARWLVTRVRPATFEALILGLLVVSSAVLVWQR